MDSGDSYICIQGYDEGLSLIGEYFILWMVWETAHTWFGEAGAEGSGYAFNIGSHYIFPLFDVMIISLFLFW